VNSELRKGVVVKSTGSWYKIRLGDGEIVDARTRGKLRQQGSKNTNPVTVGDRVDLMLEGGEYMIEHVDERSNYIIRKSTNLSKQTHIIAANLDLALLITTVKAPKLKLGFIDRFLVTAEAYDIPATLVFNKDDLLTKEESEWLDELIAAYGSVGYPSLRLSVHEGKGMEALKQLIEGKTVLVGGHSGVGKSSLLNLLHPGIDAKVSEISDANEKGQHTTTFAEMHTLNETTHIIDTPGIKSFGMTDMEPEELKNYFPEMVARSADCKFHNCQHLNEPKCAVRDGFESGELPYFRYENYQALMHELANQ